VEQARVSLACCAARLENVQCIAPIARAETRQIDAQAENADLENPQLHASR
jgi:hypothetical protein